MKRPGPAILERRFVPKGALLMEQGEAANSAYIIQSGEVEVFTQVGEQETKLAVLGIGEIFGEMALIFDEPRTASVRATKDCNLIVITRQALKTKIDQSDPTIKAIMQMLTKRVVSSNNSLVNKSADIGDLEATTRIIYDNILSAMPKNRQDKFQASVLPKLDEFMKALKSFDS